MCKSLKILAISFVCLVAIYSSNFLSQEANAQQIQYHSVMVHGPNVYTDYAMGRKTVAMPTRSDHPYYNKITTDEYYEQYKNVNCGRRIYRRFNPINNKRHHHNAKRQNPYFSRNRSNPYFARY